MALAMVLFSGVAWADTKVTPAVLAEIGQDALSAKTAPGIAYAVVSHGHVAYAGGFGMSDTVAKTPVTPTTRFAIGSMSKQFTAAAVLLLVQRGVISLDDKLDQYVPSLPNARTITVRMLLHQTSGLHNFPNTSEHPWPLEGVIEPAKIFAFLATDKSDFAPGTKWAYSNANYAALAEVVAKASGTSYATFLGKNIFAPLQMGRSDVGFAAQRQLATAYRGATDFHKQEGLSLDLYYGAGDIVSTVDDLTKWDLALLSGKLLDRASMNALWSAGTLANGTPVDYAMGFVPTTVHGHREVWHNGLTPGAGGYTYNALFPDDQLAVIVLSNGMAFMGEPEKMVERTLRAFVPDIPAPVTATKPTDEPATNALVRTLLAEFRSGKLDRSRLTTEFDQAITPAMLEQMRPSLASLGALSSLQLESKLSSNGTAEYAYEAQFAAAKLHVQLVVRSDGKVAGFGVTP